LTLNGGTMMINVHAKTVVILFYFIFILWNWEFND